MKQNILVKKIVEELIKYNYLGACYLTGSLGRGEEDIYSDVEMHCYFFTDVNEEYEKNKFDILESYAPIVFYKKQDNLDVVVYSDGIMLKLYHDYPTDGIIRVDTNVKIVFNDFNIINATLDNVYRYTNQEIGSLIDEFSLNCLEFYRFFMKNDYPVVLHIASDIHYKYSCIVHFVTDYDYAKLGSKNILKGLNQGDRAKYIDILKKYSYSNLKQFVNTMINDISSILTRMPVSIANYFNIDFFEFVKKKINEL